MVESSITYKPEYANSHALVIGINAYKKCSLLAYARQDAESIAETLEKKFTFPKANIHILLDADAKKDSILSAYLRFAQDNKIKDDDRLLVFFAGHGITKDSSRGGCWLPCSCRW